jgi:hypothetical protein
VIVDHAGPPPWASELDHHHHDFPGAEEVIASLELGEDWERVRVDAVEREVAGQTAAWTDNVIVLRRR